MAPPRKRIRLMDADGCFKLNKYKVYSTDYEVMARFQSDPTAFLGLDSGNIEA